VLEIKMIKKSILSLFILLLISSFNIAYSQKINKTNIVGVWQVSTFKTGSALLANYRFFSNGKFIYTFNAYDDRSRIRGAEGVYSLLGNTLKLYIRFRIEEFGGDLVQGGMGFQQEEIVLEGGKVVKVAQKSKRPIELEIETCKSKTATCMKLQNNTYYKISKDPLYQ
jgi:hypothetical protein